MHESMAWNVNKSADGLWHASRGGGVEDHVFESLSGAINHVRHRTLARVSEHPRHRRISRWPWRALT